LYEENFDLEKENCEPAVDNEKKVVISDELGAAVSYGWR
jgi:hypothetical protein